MKRILLVSIMLFLTACTFGNSEPSISTLSAQEFSQVIQDSEVFVIDTHIPEQEHIAGTDAFIAFDALEQNRYLLPEDKDTPIAVYCRSGSMSAKAAQTLQDMGYKTVYDLDGGTNAWRASNLHFSGAQFEDYSVIERKVTMFKSPTCGCCVGYGAELENEGFEVETIPTVDMSAIKREYNIPRNMESCHTSIIGDYFVEGHVPIQAVNKLLDEQPDIDGIALPNMPAGSPGMPGLKRGSWTIYALNDGEVSEYMTI